MDFRQHLRPTRSLLSGYYIALLFSTLIFRLDMFQRGIIGGQKFVEEMLGKLFASNSDGSTAAVWFSLLLVCFIIMFSIKQLVVDPIHLSIEDESGVNAWEKFFFFFMVFGAFLYYVNDYFKFAMPVGIPLAIRQFLGDVNVSEQSHLWFSSLFWNIGPLATIFVIVRTKGSGEGGGDHH